MTVKGKAPNSVATVERVLAVTAAVVRSTPGGFVSKAAATKDAALVPTADIVAKYLTVPTDAAFGPIGPPTSDDVALAVDALAWARSLTDHHSDYFRSIASVAAGATVTDRQIGIAASIIPAYQREIAHLAKPKTPVVCGRVRITGKVVSTKQQHTRYGTVTKVTVHDDRGFRVWGTLPSAVWDADPGDVIAFTATVSISDRDPEFGFFKRPADAEYVTYANGTTAEPGVPTDDPARYVDTSTLRPVVVWSDEYKALPADWVAVDNGYGCSRGDCRCPVPFVQCSALPRVKDRLVKYGIDLVGVVYAKEVA